MEEKALRKHDDLIAQVKQFHARQSSSQPGSPSQTPRRSPSRLRSASRDSSPQPRTVGRSSAPDAHAFPRTPSGKHQLGACLEQESRCISGRFWD